MGLFAFIVVGLVVGLGARSLIDERRAKGFVPTALFGLAGSFAGGLIGMMFYGRRVFELHSSGVLASVFVAFTVLIVAGLRARARRRVPF